MEESEEKQDRNLHETALKDKREESRISKLAILSLVLGILSLLFFVLAGIPAVVVGIIGMVRISGSGGTLRGRAFAAAGTVFSILGMISFCLLWSVDAPPIPNDYTIAGLRSAPPEYGDSFEILKILIDEDHNLKGAPAIGLTQEDLEMSHEIRTVKQEGTTAEISEIINYYADDIERAWVRMKEARQVVKRLDTHAEIADLTDPSFNGKFMRVRNLIELARFYQVYGYLKLQQGDIWEFAGNLIELDSVFRKLSVNVRRFVPKLVCLQCIKENMFTANAIVNDSRTSTNAVELLVKKFVQLTDEQVSLRNGVLSEYLLFKSVLSDESVSRYSGKIRLLKPNSTLRLYKNCCDEWLDRAHLSSGTVTERLSVWPDFYPFDEPDPLPDHTLLPIVYRCYNPLGSQFIHMLGFFYAADAEKGDTISVLDDLLQIVLNKRLGKEVSLKARAYSKEYIVDVENKKILSPGPDGKAGTKDDISLPINPEALGWEN
ncbi:MAG: DUF4190 domain-containing protein [Phycisphaerales bacterium]|nr:MAG: DUF4190 domain-containing protein [Phycisphaerales bacterium]